MLAKRISPEDYEAGTELYEQYTIQKEMNKGGMSVLRPALNRLDKKVMIKFCHNRDTYQKEVDILTQLQRCPSPNIISLDDCFDDEEEETSLTPHWLIVVELGEVSLQDWGWNKRPISETFLKTIILVYRLYRSSVSVGALDVHCDLKPGNVMRFKANGEERGIWKLIDFDSSCAVGEKVERGTVDFCAPEVIRASGSGKHARATLAMDIFSFGQIIYWMATDKPIWGDHVGNEAAMAVILSQEEELPLSKKDIPHLALFHLAQDMLYKDPEKRLTLIQLKKKSYLIAGLDTRMARDIGLQKTTSECNADDDIEEEDLVIPEENTAEYIHYPKYVQHRILRHEWNLSHLGRTIDRDQLERILKKMVASDIGATKAFGLFMSQCFPLKNGAEVQRSADSVENNRERIEIEEVNAVFPKESSKILPGDWIIYHAHKAHHSRIFTHRHLKSEILKLLDERPVLHLCHEHKLSLAFDVLRSSEKTIFSMVPIPKLEASRVLKVLDHLNYQLPPDEEEPHLYALLRLTEKLRELSLECATILQHPGKALGDLSSTSALISNHFLQVFRKGVTVLANRLDPGRVNNQMAVHETTPPQPIHQDSAISIESFKENNTGIPTDANMSPQINGAKLTAQIKEVENFSDSIKSSELSMDQRPAKNNPSVRTLTSDLLRDIREDLNQTKSLLEHVPGESVQKTWTRFVDNATKVSTKYVSAIIPPEEEKVKRLKEGIREWYRLWIDWRKSVIVTMPSVFVKFIEEEDVNLATVKDKKAYAMLQEETAEMCGAEEEIPTGLQETYYKAYKGDCASLLALGKAYMDGKEGLRPSRHLACMWLLRAAIQNNPEAQTLYAMSAERAENTRCTSAVKYAFLRRAHSLKYAPAKAKYAYLLWEGEGCIKDKSLAAKLIHQSADQDRPEGYLGLLYMALSTGDVEGKDKYGRKCFDMGCVLAYQLLFEHLLLVRQRLKNEDPGPWYAAAYRQYQEMLVHERTEEMPCQSKWVLESLYADYDIRTLKSICHYFHGVMLYFGLGVSEDKEEAVRVWEKEEHPTQMIRDCLAYCYATGDGKPLDVSRAIQMLSENAQTPSTKQDMILAFLYYKGSEMTQDPKKVRRLCERAMMSSLPNAAYLLGRMEEEGFGGEVNLVSAAKLYERFHQESLMCAAAMARMKLYGRGCVKDVGLALKALEHYAQPGSPGGSMSLATFFWPDVWYDPMMGNLEALKALGDCYAWGIGGEPEMSCALKMWTRAASLGSGEAHLCLYQVYSQGMEIPLNLQVAEQHLKKASDMGVPEAMALYARDICEDPKRYEEALALSRKSLYRKYEPARIIHAQLLLNDPSKKDEEVRTKEAIQPLQQGVENGDGESMYQLSCVEEDPKKTSVLLHRTTTQGVEKAPPKLAECYSKDRGTDEGYGPAQQYYRQEDLTSQGPKIRKHKWYRLLKKTKKIFST
ncbi:hypothetical protein BJ684DRAFT_15506 [Piptocephalis cylindrospora]|uniref:Protein kinase domain-containing protein n=1 Tax=Piptocephalis cylindrospora TaxID=1907219 RepID=A0A4P9Y5D3_9FUNG|nr:hypothetical protein BJ684DRAFT_15506 [Piptocephalis cylindrospora]|eukprot:RKP14153.1 hypothetical protein BJ684DRAFT_15506 [Piptocephalis cylindrospora]